MSKNKVRKEKDTETFGTILLAKREELYKRMAQYREEIQCEQDPDDDTAAALRSFERDLAITNLNRVMRTLREVEAALRSIETGDYGYCVRCGATISDARLHALPWTRVCLECAGGGVRRIVLQGERAHPQVVT